MQHLSKSYGKVKAVVDLSFTVKTGEIFGFLGPNGAGKTMTLSVLEGLLTADEGQVAVLGMDLHTHRQAVQRRIGVQLQSTSLLPDLTVLEQAQLFAILYDCNPNPNRLRGCCRWWGWTTRSPYHRTNSAAGNCNGSHSKRSRLMKERHQSNAASITATVFGILAGLGGLTHGVGEVLQGNVQADGPFIASWTQGPIASNMGGEPGLTIVPNLLVTGILTIVTSLALILWAVAGRSKVQGKRYGLVLVALSVVMLLVGGGVGPPVIGILAGIAGMGPSATDRRRLSDDLRRKLAAGWPWVFGVTAANGVFLVIGSLILVYLFDVNKPDLFTNSFFFSVVSLLATIVVGRAHDRIDIEPKGL